jgi:hypothetical protein
VVQKKEVSAMSRCYVKPIGTKKDDSFYVPYDILRQAWIKVCRNLTGGLCSEEELPEMLDRTVRGCAYDVDYEVAEKHGGKKFSRRELLDIVFSIYQRVVLDEIESAVYRYRCGI